LLAETLPSYRPLLPPTGRPERPMRPSSIHTVSHCQHSGLLRQLGLLCYTRWHLSSRSAVDDVTIIDHFVQWSRQAL